MVKKNLLKVKMLENEKNYRDCSTTLNISDNSFYNKINSNTEFKISEVVSLSNFLNLADTDTIQIFLR